MRLKASMAALAAAVVAVAISGTAVAGQPIGGCNAGYSLIKAKVDPKADKNGDGWICSEADRRQRVQRLQRHRQQLELALACDVYRRRRRDGCVQVLRSA